MRFRCVSFLLTMNKYLREHIKGGVTYFSSQTKKFQTRILGSLDSGPMVRGEGVRNYSPHGGQEMHRGKGGKANPQ